MVSRTLISGQALEDQSFLLAFSASSLMQLQYHVPWDLFWFVYCLVVPHRQFGMQF
jgi:hypothetical protein